MPVEAFKKEFEYLIELEPPHLVIDPERGLVEASEERAT